MSTLRINNIEAKSVPASPTIDEKVKITNSSGDVLVHIDGKTSGITTIGINTTSGNIKFDANSNVVVTGIITATKFVGIIEPTDLTVSGKVSVGGSVTAATFYGSGANLTSLPAQATIANNADNRVITGGSGVNLNGEANLQFNGTRLDIDSSAQNILQLNSTHSDGPNIVFQRSGSNLGYLGSAAANTGGAATDLTLRSQANLTFASNGGNERLRITSGGHISQGGGAEPSSTNGAIGLKHGIKSSANNIIIGETTQAGSGYGLHIESRQTGRSGNARIAQIGMKNDASGNGQISFFTAASGADVSERLRIASAGQIGVAGANYGTARETIVSGGASAAVSWSANPFVIDMVGLGDIDYGKMFVRYRETATVSGNGLIYLGICKSTTNCPAGRAGTPIGFIPSTTYNGHFRVDKIGITPWPDGSGHRYEYYAIISDYASSGKLGVFYLTNTTS